MTRKPLSEAEIASQLEQLSGWTLKSGKLHRELSFADFKEAFGFMTKAAMLSEQMNHHAEWFNVYNRVTIDLHTHDANGITQLDVDWAKAADAFCK